MPKLLYISLMRLPTEKAHGLQIMQNCEAFAAAGYEVTLSVARRWNTREMRQVSDPFAHYGVDRNFEVRRIPCVDLFPLFPEDSFGARLAFYMLQLSYALMMMLKLLFTRADIYYSRDEFLLALLSWLKPKATLAYEAHLYPTSGRGAALQSKVCKNVGSVIAITPQLRDDLIGGRGADPARTIVAHDGIRKARFAELPDRWTARRQIGWDENAIIVGYVGRLQMIGMDKGVGTLLGALARVEDAHLALVGGPDQGAQRLRQQWVELGMAESRFHYVGQVPPQDVARYLAAFDICAMPHPRTTQFSRYTSPLKLFEYMASSSAIVASDLPGWSDVVSDGETAMLVPPADVAAWAEAIERLRDNPELRQRLGKAARNTVMENFTWSTRARKILSHIASA